MQLSDTTIWSLLLAFIITAGVASYDYWFSSKKEELVLPDIWLCPKCGCENHDDLTRNSFICASCNNFFYWEEISWSDYGVDVYEKALR